MKMKRVSMVILLFVFIVGMMGSSLSVHAATKKKIKYTFSPANCSSFKLDGNKLTVKLSGSTFYKNGKETREKKKTFRVSSKCKWKYENFERSNGDNSLKDSNYKEIKAAIKKDRSIYKKYRDYSIGNVGMSLIEVKNGKVVKINYVYVY